MEVAVDVLTWRFRDVNSLVEVWVLGDGTRASLEDTEDSEVRRAGGGE